MGVILPLLALSTEQGFAVTAVPQAIAVVNVLRGNRMLRIPREANGDVVFSLSGRIRKEHVTELETLVAAEDASHRIALDLEDMTLTGGMVSTFLPAARPRHVG